jgi:ankyrin repeat protein
VRDNWWEAYKHAIGYRPFLVGSPQFGLESSGLFLLHIACCYGIDQLAWKLLMEPRHLHFRKRLRKAGHLAFWNLQFRKILGADRKAGMALTLAAEEGHKTIVELLLAKGADVNAKDDEDQSALVEAAWRGHKTVVQLLLANGADINTEDWLHRTALTEAAKEGHETIVQLLLAKGADINAGGGAALAKAARERHEANVQFLLT